MDTLTHALSGALAARLCVRPPDPQHPNRPAVWQAVTVGTVAALFPDGDFVLAFISEMTYLRGHRGMTHSLLLLPLWGLLIAWAMAALFRVTHRPGQPRPDWKNLYFLACLALLLHILGDLITQFGTMLLSPLSDRRFSLSTTFIIDLGISGILLAGLIASAAWRRSRLPAALATLALLGWIGHSAMARSDALEAARQYAEQQGIPIVALDAAPRPVSPHNWTAIVFDGQNYHYANLNTRRSTALIATPDDPFLRRLSAPYPPIPEALWQVAPRFGEDDAYELARRVWKAEEFAFFRWFAMFPVLDHVTAEDSPDGLCAGFRDLRFETPGLERTPFRYGLCQREGRWWMFELTPQGRRPLAG